MTNKEAIAVLDRIYGMVSTEVQRAIDVAYKAIEEKDIQERYRLAKKYKEILREKKESEENG